MKITQAHEIEEVVEATVTFPDGFTQSVRLPNWATKTIIKAEAQRLRKQIEGRESNKQARPDLQD